MPLEIIEGVEVLDVRPIDPSLTASKCAGAPVVAEIEVIEECDTYWRVRLPQNIVVAVPKLSAAPVADTVAELA